MYILYLFVNLLILVSPDYSILVPEFGYMHLELIPMLVGFFTYKIATFVQAIEEAITVATRKTWRISGMVYCHCIWGFSPTFGAYKMNLFMLFHIWIIDTYIFSLLSHNFSVLSLFSHREHFLISFFSSQLRVFQLYLSSLS